MLRLELGLLITGLIASLLMLAIAFWWGVLAESPRELLRPGNIGAQALAVLVIAGVVGMILLPVNIVIGNRRRMWMRVLMASAMLLALILVSSRM